MERTPLVTIAIATTEDESRIEPCLRSVLLQDYPGDSIEVVVADAMSMDATREIVLRIAAEDARVRLIDNPSRTRAGALNAVLKECRGEIVVPMDPDGHFARTHVSKCVEALSQAPADQLAIVPRSSGRTLVERALSAAQSTRLAFARGAELVRGSESATAFIGAVRKSIFERVEYLDDGAKDEEDVELARRITRAGGALTVRRDIVVHRSDAASFKDLFLRHYQLGWSRGRRIVKDRRVSSLRELLPFAIVACGGVLAATTAVQPITPLAAAAYALWTGAAAVRVGRREGVVTVPLAWAAYPVMHVAHGAGFGAGLVRAALRPDWKEGSAHDENPVEASPNAPHAAAPSV